MVRIAAAAVLAFAVSTMALSGEAIPAKTAALRARDDAEVPKPDVPPPHSAEDFNKWMATIEEAAGQLQKMALDAVANQGKTE
ncbi:hypothetical protein BBO_04411 [Beauveria brongniartii RCEF 3172]|uniref:Uncharacterized protein n=1 Tax=Beauveria brongniartii RCEF 3172 TaxID=1081107 RepID=A0A162HVS0_9HYPO|nr:hypothetical protein BBO_04411 [Beauveria brongniartii RCEF 3172]